MLLLLKTGLSQSDTSRSKDQRQSEDDRRTLLMRKLDWNQPSLQTRLGLAHDVAEALRPFSPRRMGLLPPGVAGKVETRRRISRDVLTMQQVSLPNPFASTASPTAGLWRGGSPEGLAAQRAGAKRRRNLSPTGSVAGRNVPPWNPI